MVRLARQAFLEVGHRLVNGRPAGLTAGVRRLYHLVERLHLSPRFVPDLWSLNEYKL